MTGIDDIREHALDHFYGRNGMDVSYDKAYMLFSKIPEDPWSQYIIGLMLDHALYLREDKKKAFELFRRSSEQGNSGAQYMVGLRIENEMGGVPAERCEHFNRSAEQGNPDALCALGLKYTVEGDREKAFACLTKAAEAGSGEAYCRMAYLHRYGSLDVGNRSETDEEKAKDCYAKAFDTFMRSADKGDALMQYRVGEMYFYGNHVPVDKIKAAEWFERSAEFYGNAYLMLTIMYEKGDGVGQDLNKAFEYCSKAAERGIGEALFQLSRMYREGIGTQKDIESAKKYHEKALDKGYIPPKSYSHVP